MDGIKDTFEKLTLQAKISFSIFMIGFVFVILLMLLKKIPVRIGALTSILFLIQSISSAYAVNCLSKGNCDVYAYVINFMHFIHLIINFIRFMPYFNSKV